LTEGWVASFKLAESSESERFIARVHEGSVFGKPVAANQRWAGRSPLPPIATCINWTSSSSPRAVPKCQMRSFLRRHYAILAQERWVVDGFGTPQAFEAMLRRGRCAGLR
jgi:hypothetical protein